MGHPVLCLQISPNPVQTIALLPVLPLPRRPDARGSLGARVVSPHLGVVVLVEGEALVAADAVQAFRRRRRKEHSAGVIAARLL